MRKMLLILTAAVICSGQSCPVSLPESGGGGGNTPGEWNLEGNWTILGGPVDGPIQIVKREGCMDCWDVYCMGRSTFSDYNFILDGQERSYQNNTVYVKGFGDIWVSGDNFQMRIELWERGSDLSGDYRKSAEMNFNGTIWNNNEIWGTGSGYVKRKGDELAVPWGPLNIDLQRKTTSAACGEY